MVACWFKIRMDWSWGPAVEEEVVLYCNIDMVALIFVEADQVPAPPHTGLITSTSNRYVKHCVRLRTDGRYRRRVGRLILPGSLLLQELQGGVVLDVQRNMMLLPSCTDG